MSGTRSVPRLGFWTATSMVVANMIGTGVFTTLGFQVEGTPSAFPVLLLWIVGGVAALCGALTYGELGAALPRSGGEYHLLSRILHPALGFLAGWASATVGFAAPTALAAIGFSTYLRTAVPSVPVVHGAALLVLGFAAVHASSVWWGTRITNALTIVKVGLLVLFVGAAAGVSSPTGISPLPTAGDAARIATPAFAVSLVYVSYAYTGWNAAVYIVGEMESPRHLPRALLAGTALVTVLYALVNFAFLRTVPMDELSGQIEVGYLSASRMFGGVGAKAMAVTIALILTSAVSVMIYVGPRILQIMGEDVALLRPLARRSSNGVPLYALATHTAITLAFIYTATFQQVLLYAGFTLNLVTATTVASVFVLRRREPALTRPYRTWGYPWTPLVFLGLSVWSSTFMLLDKPLESLAGLVTLGAGLIIYSIDRMRGSGAGDAKRI